LALRIKDFFKLAGFFIKSRLLGKKLPLIASFKLTYRCNLKCVQCPFHLRANEPGAHISWDDAQKALLKLKDSGCLFVIFEGGEPLLWKDGSHDFNDLAVFAKKHFLRVGVTTNGTFPLDVKTDLLWVSLDGMKETHDSLRENSFDRAISNIRSSSHKKLLIHYTFNRTNIKDFEGLCLMLRNIAQVKGITVQFYYPYSDNDSLSMTTYDRRQAVETIIRIKKNGIPILNSSSALHSMIYNKWQCHEHLLANIEPDGKLFFGCYAKGRGAINCRVCGFTPVAEASGAYDFLPESVISGLSIFLL
jgi:MoaA/NifB/PqqE/SkfB family radical SAM enzyme